MLRICDDNLIHAMWEFTLVDLHTLCEKCEGLHTSLRHDQFMIRHNMTEGIYLDVTTCWVPYLDRGENRE